MVGYDAIQPVEANTKLNFSNITGGRKRRRRTRGKHSKVKHSKVRHSKSKNAKTKKVKGKRPVSKWIIFVKKFSVKNGK